MADPKKHKQIVFLMTDTTRWDMVNCYRETGLKTPNLDALAANGIRYERAYTCQPVCGPARSAIFTGTFPHSCNGWTNSMALCDNAKTVGQRLSDHGYHTAYIGKYHLDGGDYFGLGKCPDGWDPEYWFDMRCYLENMSDDDRRKSRKSSTMKKESISPEFTFGHQISDRAIDFLERYRDSDFFLVASYDEPHGPYLCPEPYASMYQDFDFPASENLHDTLENKPEHQQIWAGKRRSENREEVRIHKPFFFGCNSFADAEMGRVIDKVHEVAPDALIVYTSDHGDALQSHCLNSKGPATYDEIARIPLIISGGTAHKGVYRSPVSHINLVPTILEYFGIPIPKLLEGKSILPTVYGSEEPVNDAVFIEFGRYEIDHDGFGGFQPLRAVFDGRYKLTVNLLSSDELYDLENDPAECRNLIWSEETAEIRNRLHDRLLAFMNETRDPFRGYYWERRPWRTDASPATWEYTGYTRQRENEEYEPRQFDYDTGLPMKEATRKKKV